MHFDVQEKMKNVKIKLQFKKYAQIIIFQLLRIAEVYGNLHHFLYIFLLLITYICFYFHNNLDGTK